MMSFKGLAIAQVHMYTAGQAGVEAADSAHNVDTLEFILAVFLEDRRVLHRIFIRSRRAIDIARIGVPRCWRVRMIVGYLAFANDHVMRQYTSNGLVETATDSFLGHLEVVPRPGMAGVDFRERLLHEMQCATGGVHLK